MKIIDLRSDTCSLPTEKMIEAMRNAKVGNAGLKEDPTVNKLEEIAAEKLGKEKAIFIPSGTMGNVAAIMAHTRRGDRIIVGAESHIYLHELGGYATLNSVSACSILEEEGCISENMIERAIKGERLTQLRISLICVENTHNLAGGRVIKPEKLKKIWNIANRYRIPIHLDGERIFQASVHLNIDVKEITQYADSVMIGLSKDLCCPVGSILAGDSNFIEKAWQNVKLLGGAMRQAGYIAAPGIIALEEMVERLKEDQIVTKKIAIELEKLPEICLDSKKVETNIIKFGIKCDNGLDAIQFSKKIREYGILCNAIDDFYIRMVVYRNIKESDVKTIIEKIREYLKSRKYR
ncbi:MAG: threonine aldolase family protein [Promethearchaeota archaeon]